MLGDPSPWASIYNEFEPETPAKMPAQRADRTYSPVSDIVRSLSRPFGAKKFLITGSVGTGKTTELLRIAEQQVDHHLVVFFDVYSHFEGAVKDPHAINNLQSWELLFLTGLAVYQAAKVQLNHTWSPETTAALTKAAEQLQGPKDKTKIDVAKLASSVVVFAGGTAAAAIGGPPGTMAAVTAGLKLVQDGGTAVRWDLQIGSRSRDRRSDQDRHVRDMLGAVNLVLSEIQEEYRKVLVLLDGLDRIKDKSNIEALFVQSNLLSDLVCPMVAIAPISVRRDHMDNVRGFEAKDLVNVPVVDRTDPNYPALGTGVPFFHDLVNLRLEKLGLTDASPFSKEQIDHLAWCSGGRARDFVKLIRGVAERAYDAGSTQASGELVEQAIDEARRNKESGLNKTEIELLQAVLMDEQRTLPGGETAIALLDRQRLVPYPNESTWYFPHPLLTLKLVTKT